MKLSVLQSIENSLQTLEEYYGEFCRPNPNYIKDRVQFEFTHKRNKAFLMIETFMICVFIFNLLTKRGSPAYNIQGVIGTLGIVAVFFLSCRYHPEVFKIFFNVVLLLYGPHLIYHDQEGVLGAWIALQSHPTLVYLVTGSIWHFVFHTGVLTVLVGTIYQDLIMGSLLSFSPTSFITAFTYYSHQTTLYSLAFTILTHKILQNAYQHIAVGDQKKEDFERQKSFVLGFSHELRNIINSMMGNIGLASLENLNEKTAELLKNAEVCAEVLTHLVNNILDTGKLQIGDLEITPAPIKIYDVVEKLWGVSSELIKRKKLIGRLKVKKDIPQVLIIDHYRLTQIFLNLVGNAVKFTESGTIDISIEWIANTPAVQPSCFRPAPFNEDNSEDEGVFEKSQALSVFNDDLMFLNFSKKKFKRNLLISERDASKGVLKITVSDTGVGMKKEELDKLFQKFAQVTSDVSKKQLGTGLGLFITRELCRGMNGEIKAYSKKDKGSVFTLCLPVEPVVEEETLSVLDINNTRSLLRDKDMKAMIVDDEHFSRLILTNFLTRLGVEVANTAENGLIGYEKYASQATREDPIHVVTMDLDMPIMKGKDAAQKIREFELEKGLQPCTMIIISANCTESEIKECLEKNGRIRANAFLKKPVTMDELYRVISCSLLHRLSRQRSDPFH